MWGKWFPFKKQLSSQQTSDGVIELGRIPVHVAIIMDGNGRWAKQRNMPRIMGHRAGAETLRTIVKKASELGIKVLTAYAFSTENWKRPASEVNFLMDLLSEYIDHELDELQRNKVQLRFIGDTDALPMMLQDKMMYATNYTKNNSGLILNLAVNYGGRSELVRAIRHIAHEVSTGTIIENEITEDEIKRHLYTADLPDPDLLIRPGGDYRISNYLLWQLAYTEFWFTPVLWPDFTPEHLLEAIHAFQSRERRFGGLKT